MCIAWPAARRRPAPSSRQPAPRRPAGGARADLAARADRPSSAIMSSPTSRLLQPALLAALMVCLVLAGGGGRAAAGRRDGQRGTVQGPAGAALDAYLRRLEVFGFSGSVPAGRRAEGRSGEHTAGN